MKTIIDNLNTVAGWAGAVGASIHGLNSIADYTFGNNTESIVFKFDALNSSVTKDYTEDVTDYSTLTFYIWSQNKYGSDFIKPDDFNYKIEIGAGNTFYIPVSYGMNQVTVDISSITSLDLLKITALHATTDYLIMSYCVASFDELPLDIFVGIQEQLESNRDDLIDPILLGTASGVIADTTIVLTDLPFIDDYASIKIDDGVNNEIHQLRIQENFTYSMTDLYNGESLLHDYIDANIYLYLPITYGRDSLEATIPGITLWGFEPEEMLHGFNLDTVYDSWADAGAAARREGHYLKWPISFDCEARQDEILSILSGVVRRFIGRKLVYINGRKFRVSFNSTPTEIRPTEFYDIIPKVTYMGEIEIREELWVRTNLAKTTAIDFQAIIQ